MFEEHFFHFRSSVKGFEKQLVVTLNKLLDHTPSLQAKLRVVEMFQGVFKREAIMVSGFVTCEFAMCLLKSCDPLARHSLFTGIYTIITIS